MATTVAAATQNPVPLPEIPVKLRCNICSGLARGAVRLPCCEQAICETCRANLPNVCPVCDHSPLNADDCKPNSALRTTVAVFLRTAEKKHALALQKEQKATQQQQHLQLQQQKQPMEPIATPEVKAPEPQPAEQAVPAAGEDQLVTPAAKPNTPILEGDAGPLEEKKQEPTSVTQRDTENTAQGKTDKPEAKAGPHDVAPQQMGYNQPNDVWFNGQAQDQMTGIAQPMFPGQDMSAWGGYGAQGVWENGYGNGMMGYQMMNPMVMAQSGYGGGNFGNMGVGGYNGQNGGGMDWDNGWGGQNNMGYNQGMTGMRNGGYYSAASAAGGYNHQSQGSHQVPSQQYQNPHFQRQQNFPRGGGFAGGVGNRPYNSSDSSSQQHLQQQPQQQAYGESAFQQQIQGIEDVAVAVKKAPSSTGAETKGEKIPSIVSGDSDDIDVTTSSAIIADKRDAVVPTETESTVVAGLGEDIAAGTDSTGMHTSIPTAPMSQPDVAAYPNTLHDDYSGQNFQNFHQQPYINGYQGRGGYSRGGFSVGGRGGFRGNGHFGMRGGYGMDGTVPNGIPMGNDKIPPPGFGKGVEGAPTGPKAMREGKPNRGIMPRAGGFVGRGGYTGGGGGGGGGCSSWSRSHSPPDRNNDRTRSYSRSVSIESRHRSRSARSRDDSRDRNRRHSRSVSRDRDHSRNRRHRSRSRTRRSPTPSKDSDGYQSERGRTPKRDGEDTDKVSSPIKTPQSAKLASVPEDSQPPSGAPSGRGKRSREASGSRERDQDQDQDQELAASRATSRSRSRSGERRHKRTRRHRRRSTSPDREKDKDRSSRHHRKSHRSHRSSRKHRRSRSRTPRSRSRSPRRELSDTEDRIAEDVGDRRCSRRSSKERRHKRRSRKEESSRDRDRARGDRERGDRDRDRHRSHRSHRSSRHERHERHRDYERDNNDDINNDDKTTPTTSNERKNSTAVATAVATAVSPISPTKTKKPVIPGAGSSSKHERKLSYKYEDEGDLERRAERDREAERWGIK